MPQWIPHPIRFSHAPQHSIATQRISKLRYPAIQEHTSLPVCKIFPMSTPDQHGNRFSSPSTGGDAHHHALLELVHRNEDLSWFSRCSCARQSCPRGVHPVDVEEEHRCQEHGRGFEVRQPVAMGVCEGVLTLSSIGLPLGTEPQSPLHPTQKPCSNDVLSKAPQTVCRVW